MCGVGYLQIDGSDARNIQACCQGDRLSNSRPANQHRSEKSPQWRSSAVDRSTLCWKLKLGFRLLKAKLRSIA
jgi:hypothetical protein